MKITIINIQTFGDYILKAPFLHELFAQHPDAEVTIVTNPRGAMVYPLVDSRLRVVPLDKMQSKWSMIRTLLDLGKADRLYVIDHNPKSYLMSLCARARKKIGWAQSVSRLYQGPQKGFQDRFAVRPGLSFLLGCVFEQRLLRRPEFAYEGHVELQLLDSPTVYPRLAQYRGPHSLQPGPKSDPPTILLCTFASWVARELEPSLWKQTVSTLLDRWPNHRIVIDGSDALLSSFASNPRIVKMARSEHLGDFFRLVASSDTVISSDSFPTHLASWFDVPAVTIFGPASPHRFAPTSPRSSILFHRPPCSPCIQQGGSNPCLVGHRECLSFQQVTSQEICDAVQAAILGVPGNRSFSLP